jgi:hypothetical protein
MVPLKLKQGKTSKQLVNILQNGQEFEHFLLLKKCFSWFLLHSTVCTVFAADSLYPII